MVQRIGGLMAALAVAVLLWALPVAAQDAGYQPPDDIQPTFFETMPPTDEPPDEPTVPPGPPPPDEPTDEPGPPPADEPTITGGPPPPDAPPAPDAPPGDGGLPATGLGVTNGMAAAGVFLVGGTGLVLAARRRRKAQQ